MTKRYGRTPEMATPEYKTPAYFEISQHYSVLQCPMRHYGAVMGHPYLKVAETIAWRCFLRQSENTHIVSSCQISL